MNLSVVDGDEAEDHRPLLPSRTVPPAQLRTPHCGIHPNLQLSAERTVWLDRTQAMASTPLYNGHLYVQPSPRCKRKGDRVKERKGEKKSAGGKQKWAHAEQNHRGGAKHAGPHGHQERGGDIPVSPRASPFKRSQHMSGHVSLEMQEHHRLPEIIITSKEDDLQPFHEPSQARPGPSEARGPLPGAQQSPARAARPPPPPPPGPKRKPEDKDDTYWKSHGIGWRLLRRRALFLRRQRLNDCALAVAVFGVVMMVLETELSWSCYSKVRDSPSRRRMSSLSSCPRRWITAEDYGCSGELANDADVTPVCLSACLSVCLSVCPTELHLLSGHQVRHQPVHHHCARPHRGLPLL